MQHPGFFERKGPFRLGDLAPRIEAELAPGTDPGMQLSNVNPLADAQVGDLAFLDNKKYLPQLAHTAASACLIHAALVGRVPNSVAAVVAKVPYRSFALALAAFYPDAMRSRVAPNPSGSLVDPSAKIEEGAVVEPGAVVGPEAWIGSGTRVAACAVVGYRCTIGRDCYIGPGASIIHALIGDKVIIHAGVRIGQDGFGFALGPKGHLKVPQIGRVIIQDDVEIGANSTIDRGVLKDTIIGEGCKIDNLVQIGHNVVMGRHCIIVGQTGIAGSAVLGNFVIMGGQSGLVGHIKVGDGAHIAGGSHAKDDVPAGARMGGTPAVSFRQWAREIAYLKRATARSAGGRSEADDKE